MALFRSFLWLSNILVCVCVYRYIYHVFIHSSNICQILKDATEIKGPVGFTTMLKTIVLLYCFLIHINKEKNADSRTKWYIYIQRFEDSVQFSSVAQSCPTLCDPMNRSTPGLPVHHHLLEFTQTHIHRVSDAFQPSHPLSSPSPPAPNPSQHQSLFQWVNSSHEVAKVLEFQL